MDLERKKELLRLVDSMGKDVNNDNCGNYIPRVINAVEIGMKYNDKNKFKTALEGMKKTSFGGKAEREGYANFVDNIIKKREYRIDSLDFEELMFVFSWLRRVVKTKADKKSPSNERNNNYQSRDSSYNKQGYNGRNNFGKSNANNRNRNNNNSQYNTNYNRQNSKKNNVKVFSDDGGVNDNPFAGLAALKEKL